LSFSCISLASGFSRACVASAAIPPLQDLVTEHARIASHLEEAEKQLADATHALENPDARLMQEKDKQALQERIDLLQARMQIGRRHLSVVDDVKVIRDEKNQLRRDDLPLLSVHIPDKIAGIEDWWNHHDQPHYPRLD
jgi:hypothetical protein